VARPTITIDCDDVLIASLPFVVAEYDRLYGTRIDIAKAYTTGGGQWGTSDKELIVSRITGIQLSDGFVALKPMSGSQHALEALQNTYELHLVTSRSEAVTATTQTMVDTYFSGVFTGIHHVGGGGSKRDTFTRLAPVIAIDDNLKKIDEALLVGTKTGLLFGDYPWNESMSLPIGVTRVENWAAVERYVYDNN